MSGKLLVGGIIGVIITIIIIILIVMRKSTPSPVVTIIHKPSPFSQVRVPSSVVSTSALSSLPPLPISNGIRQPYADKPPAYAGGPLTITTLATPTSPNHALSLIDHQAANSADNVSALAGFKLVLLGYNIYYELLSQPLLTNGAGQITIENKYSLGAVVSKETATVRDLNKLEVLAPGSSFLKGFKLECSSNGSSDLLRWKFQTITRASDINKELPTTVNYTPWTHAQNGLMLILTTSPAVRCDRGYALKGFTIETNSNSFRFKFIQQKI